MMWADPRWFEAIWGAPVRSMATQGCCCHRMARRLGWQVVPRCHREHNGRASNNACAQSYVQIAFFACPAKWRSRQQMARFGTFLVCTTPQSGTCGVTTCAGTHVWRWQVSLLP